MAALLGVLILDTLPGLFIGIAVSLLLLLYRVSAPHIAVLGRISDASGQYGDLERHPENEVVPGLVILRVDGGLFFANADGLHKRLLSEGASADIQEIVLDAETVPFLDATAAKMLGEVASELSAQGVRLVLAHSIGDVRHLLRRRKRRRSGSTRRCRRRSTHTRAESPQLTQTRHPTAFVSLRPFEVSSW